MRIINISILESSDFTTEARNIGIDWCQGQGEATVPHLGTTVPHESTVTIMPCYAMYAIVIHNKHDIALTTYE